MYYCCCCCCRDVARRVSTLRVVYNGNKGSESFSKTTALYLKNIRFPLLLHLLFITFAFAIMLCAQLWYAFFTNMKKAYHSREECVPQLYASFLHTLFAKGTYALYARNTCCLPKEHEAFVTTNCVIGIGKQAHEEMELIIKRRKEYGNLI